MPGSKRIFFVLSISAWTFISVGDSAINARYPTTALSTFLSVVISWKPLHGGTLRSDFVSAKIYRRVLFEDFIDSTMLNDCSDEYSSIIIGLFQFKCTGINSVCVPWKDLWIFLSNWQLGSRLTQDNSSAKSYFSTSIELV